MKNFSAFGDNVQKNLLNTKKIRQNNALIFGNTVL